MGLKKGKKALYNVFLYYTQVNPKFPATSFKKKIWKTDVLVEKKDVLALRKRYPKVKAFSKGTIANNAVEDAAEFEEKYKCAPPYEAEEYYFVEFNTYAAYQDGNINENNIVEIVNIKGGADLIQTSIGNGSKGHVQWRERTFEFEGTPGLTLDLTRIGIVDLVAYEGSTKKNDGEEEESAFDIEEAEENFDEEEEDTSDEKSSDGPDDDWDD